MREQEKNAITDRYDSEGAVLVRREDEPSVGGNPAPRKKSAESSGKKRESGRKTAKKPGQEAPKAPHTEEQAVSVKTPSVMKLVEDTAAMENQVIAAGKSRIPRQLRGIEPLSRVIRREAEAEKQLEEKQSAPLVTRELTAMTAEDTAPAILARFNACDCETCRRELSRLAAEELPARYIRLPEAEGLDWSGFTDDERVLIASVRKSVTTVMIRLMMGNRKRNFHG